jgi:hypothetical protein
VASLLLLLVFSCKNNSKEKTTVIETLSKEDITTSLYPESITKVFNAHGGIDKWNKMQTLSFTMEKPNGKEITTTDLKSRAELINFPTHFQGYDVESIWIKEKEGYENDGSRAEFYRGLMMYFYAMPFIVGDNGIIYEDIEPLLFEGNSYPGVMISYEAGAGSSPDDQYSIYYNSETGQMEWLSYTVTFGKDEKSSDFRYIRYNDWQTINGLVVPKSLSWYNYEDNTPTQLSRTIEFTYVVLSEKAPDYSMFKMPDGGKVIE